MLKGFKDFILRGNVVDLAVAVVIGAAFAAIIEAFTKGIINPLMALAGPNGMGLGFYLDSANKATFVDLGGIITAALNFLIVAALIYFVIVMPLAKFNERKAKGQAEDAPATETDLLTEIRDLLAKK